MSNEPVDLNHHRRAVLEKRLIRARRLLAQVEADAIENAKSVSELRAFALTDYDGADTAAAFADGMEVRSAKLVATSRENVEALQAEIDRLEISHGRL